MTLRFAYLAWVFVLITTPSAIAQQAPVLTATPYHSNGVYEVNEKVGWTVTLPKDAAPPANPFNYTVKKNNFGTPIKTGTLDLAKGSATIETSLDEPGMLFVQVTPPGGGGRGGAARGLALGAAVAPTKIEPASPKPKDFDEFWDGKLKDLAKIPVNAELTPGDSNRPSVEFSTFKMDSVGGKAQGYFAKPKKEGKFPAIVILQWAGVYALQKNSVIDRANEGWLAINVDAHDKAPSSATGAPNNYNGVGMTDREKAYFLNMYLRDYRAIEYITSRPEWDGKTLVLMGTSMGGQQSFCLAGLHPKVTHMIVNVPAGCEFSGPPAGPGNRIPASWPFNNKIAMEVGQYFDAVNFAPRIKATSFVAMGFVDTISPPVGIWATFNQIKSPKEAAPMPDSPHNNFATPQQQRPFNSRSAQWLKTLVTGGEIKVDFEAAKPKTSEPKPLGPVEARKMVGKEITVKMEVRTAKDRLENRGEIYLDAEEDFKDEKNFAVVITKMGAESLKAAGVSDPAEHFRGKTIRAHGTVKEVQDVPRIEIDDANQIAIEK